MTFTIYIPRERSRTAERLDSARERAQEQGIDTRRIDEAVRNAGRRARAEKHSSRR